MVFTSIPASAYLDAAANWQQQQHQQNDHQQGNGGSTSQQLLPPPPPPPPQPHHGGSTGSIRPGSMADRARTANLPMPETALKCPRCESTNTKFCYFNNYSLSQPRHFCKTCRRYWTRGGALRNVPVGGSCRRTKRTKGGNSNNSSTKSPATSSDRQAGSTASSTNSISSHNTASAAEILGFAPHIPSSFKFMAPLHHHQFTEFGAGDMGLNYGLYGPIGGGGGGGGGVGDLGSALGNGAGSLDQQWRMPQPQPQPQQHFPFFAGLEGSQSHASNLYPFEGSVHNEVITGGYVRPKVTSTSGVISQLASVKMEESNINRELNLSSQFFGISSNTNNHNHNNISASDQQYWTSAPAPASGTSAAWTDISGFSSSSNTSNHM